MWPKKREKCLVYYCCCCCLYELATIYLCCFSEPFPQDSVSFPCFYVLLCFEIYFSLFLAHFVVVVEIIHIFILCVYNINNNIYSWVNFCFQSLFFFLIPCLLMMMMASLFRFERNVFFLSFWINFLRRKQGKKYKKCW